jgi:hypothetical protein
MLVLITVVLSVVTTPFTAFALSVVMEDAVGAGNQGDFLYGYEDDEGNLIIPCKFQQAYDFANGKALVKQDGEWLVIDERGDATAEDPYAFYNYAQRVADGAHTFIPDTPSKWAASQVLDARAKGLIPQGLDGFYTSDVSRAEFCAFAVNLYETVKGTEIELDDDSIPYGDTEDEYVLKAAKMGLAKGRDAEAGLFDPDSSVTRQETAIFLARLSSMLTGLAETAAPSFADGDSISSWAADGVGAVQRQGIMNGKEGNRFDPLGTFSREQCIATMLRIDTLSEPFSE